MAHEIRLTGTAAAELRSCRVFEQRQIVDAMDNQLRQEPTVETRNRKCLHGLAPTFEHRPPVWELRIGEIRVFYDVDEAARLVNIRAIRRKRQGQTTEDIT